MWCYRVAWAILQYYCHFAIFVYAIIDSANLFTYHMCDITQNIAAYHRALECSINIYAKNQCCNPQIYNFIQQLLLYSRMAHMLDDVVLHVLY